MISVSISENMDKNIIKRLSGKLKENYVFLGFNYFFIKLHN